jgi:osmoprotectant transport system substrate-binding protein
MRYRRAGRAGAALMVAGLTPAACGSGGTSAVGSQSSPIVVGSQNFAESETLAYIYADALSGHGQRVTVKANVGPRETAQKAMESGAIDVEPEYVGNLLAYLDPSVQGGLSPAQAAQQLKGKLAGQKITVGAVSPAADSDAIAVNAQTESKYHPHSIPDLSPYASQLVMGGPQECATRTTCLLGLQQDYGLHFKAFKALDADGPLTREALAGNQVQVARVFSSDADIPQEGFVVLSDPKHFQLVGNIIPEVRTSAATTGVMSVLDSVSNALTTAELIQLNGQVEGATHTTPEQAAKQFVASHHLA